MLGRDPAPPASPKRIISKVVGFTTVAVELEDDTPEALARAQAKLAAIVNHARQVDLAQKITDELSLPPPPTDP